MASKGPKSGTAKPAAPKPAARAKKPVAPRAKIAAPAVEKPVPEPVAETIVPAVEAAPQEIVETVEAVTEPVVEAVTETATTAAVAETTADTVKETVKMATTVENTAAKAQAFFADFNDRTKAAVEKSTKLVEEANDFAKGNVEALVESGRIAAKGFESFGQEAAEYSRKSFETATAALKSLAAVKSPTEFFKLQSDFVRGAFDSYVAEASKNTESLLKLAGDAAQPLSNRIAVAAEKVKTAA
nr:phasin family protein [Sphingomonas sp. dw_22]